MILAKIHLTEKERPEWNDEDGWTCFVRFYGNRLSAEKMASKFQRYLDGNWEKLKQDGEVILTVGIAWDFLLQNGFKPHPQRSELWVRETLLDKIKKII